jgi:streptogramin lyase
LSGIALGLDDSIYYTYTDSGDVILGVLNPDGTASTTYNLGAGSAGTSNISISGNGEIYVTRNQNGANGDLVHVATDGTVTDTYRGIDLPDTFVPVEGVDFPGSTDTAHIEDGTVTLSMDHSIKTLYLYSGGTIDLNGYTLTVDADGGIINTGGTININGGRIDYLGLWTTTTSGPWNATSTWGVDSATLIEGTDYPGQADSVIINTGTTTLTQNQSALNVTLDAGGTLDLDGNTLNIFGDWTTNSGTLKSNPGNEGTVDFVSNSTQTILGDATFENLMKTVSQSSTLRFGTDSLVTVLNDLILSGSAQGSLLAISPTGFIPPQQVMSISLAQARDVATDSDGNIYVLVASPIGIKKYDSNGNLIDTFATSLNSVPVNGSIVIDSSDNIFVTNLTLFNTPTIEKFSATGTPLLSFGSSGSGDGEFGTLLAGLAVDSGGNIYTGDNNNRVQKFNSAGVYQSQFGSFGSGDGEFWLPWGLAVDASDNLYVTDSSNGRIQKFDSDGNYTSQFGSEGSLNGQFSGMYDGVAFDTGGNIYALDKGSSRIQIFNPDGSYKSKFGSSGSGSDQFNGPYGIHIDSDNNIYVADPSNSRVVKYSYTTFPNFNIIQTGTSGTVNVSYLSVAGSTNLSTSTFICNPCANLGNNVNWQIIQWKSKSAPTSLTLETEETATSTEETATSTATSTEEMATSTPETSTTTPATTEEEVSLVVQEAPVRRIDIQTLEDVEETTDTTVTGGIVLPATTTATTTLALTTKQSQTTKVLSNIANTIKQSYQNNIITQEDIEKVEKVVNSPVGSVVTKTVSTTGIVAGASIALAPALFSSPIALAEMWLIPTRLFGLLVGALGVRRKNRPWGTVYDSVTKRPIDPAYVSLIDIKTGKEVAQATTDLDGRYSFLVVPGMYKIIAKKTNYIPSIKMKGKIFDEVYNDLYFGEEITVQEEGQIITKNIPMDPKAFDWNEFTKNKMSVNTFIKGKDVTWAKISKVLFMLGSVASILALIFAPKPYNFIIALFYIVTYVLNYIVFGKESGYLTEKTTHLPLSFAIVKIYRDGEDEPIMKKIADKFGQYYALVPNGKYYLSIDRKNDDETYSEVARTGVINAEKCIINTSLVV